MNLGVLPHLRTSHGGALCAGLLSLVLAGLSSQAVGQPSLDGEWNEPPCVDPDPDCYPWPVSAIHAAHIANKRILVWNNGVTDPPLVWNPTDGSFTQVPTGVDFSLFCTGHAGLADGSLLLAGGGPQHNPDDEAIKFVLLGVGPWQQVASMNSARFYPTCTTLPNGRVLATAGLLGIEAGNL